MGLGDVGSMQLTWGKTGKSWVLQGGSLKHILIEMASIFLVGVIELG